MNYLKSPFTLFSLLLFAVILSAGSVSAQALKIGIVNDEEIKAGYPAWTRAAEEFDTQQKAWDEEARNMENELQEMMDDYDKQRLILSEDKRTEKEAAIRAKQESLRAYTAQIYGPGGTAEKQRDQLMIPLLDAVNKAITTVAEAEGYDVIFTMQSGLGYIKPSYDVTQKVLNALEDQE